MTKIRKTIFYFYNKFEITVLLFSIFIFQCSDSEISEDIPSATSTQTIFKDISVQANLNFIHNPAVDSTYAMPESIGSGGAFLDYDNDGDLDIYLINGAWHGQFKNKQPDITNRLFRQESDNTFTDVTDKSGLGDTGYGMGVAVGDIDNDGDVDVYISNYGRDALYRNNGDGTFKDISDIAGISNPLWGCSTVFIDYNRDGLLDIYVANYVDWDMLKPCTDRAGRLDYCGPLAFPGVPDVLYRNDGNCKFTDVSLKSGIGQAALAGLGVISVDINEDLFPDIYVSNDAEPNLLWINQKDGTFKNHSLNMGTAVNDMGNPESSMGIALGDIDNDTDLDIFITHIRTESNTLYLNGGELGFMDITTPKGLAAPSIPYTGFGTGFFDFDNDGDLDLAIANGRVTRGPLMTKKLPKTFWDDYAEPNFLFENDGKGNFNNVSHLAPDFCANVENSRGLAFGDVNNDGNIDLLLMNEGGQAHLFQNMGLQKNHWLIARAIDPDLNRDAVGAKIIITIDGQQRTRLVNPGYSIMSSHDFRVHFGLGKAKSVEQTVVLWPDGKKERFGSFQADQFITLRKGHSKITN